MRLAVSLVATLRLAGAFIIEFKAMPPLVLTRHSLNKKIESLPVRLSLTAREAAEPQS